MAYKMYLGINEGEEGFILPMLPEKLEINESGDNKTYNVINIGEINCINKPKLTEVSFESFFPKNYAPYVSVSSDQLFEPSFYISKIKSWRENQQKIRFIFVGSSFEINDLFTIESFKCYEEAGEVGDMYYSIELKKYKLFAAKKIKIVESNITKANQVSIAKNTPVRIENSNTPKTHTVQPGDTLWHISKKYLGDGNRYPEIANLNNIKNPNRIYNGQVIKIP